MNVHGTGLTFTKIAETGDAFETFGAYVPSINEGGVVAFQAASRGDRTGLHVGSGGATTRIADSRAIGAHFASHPDIDDKGRLAAYVTREEGGSGVVLLENARVARAVVSGNTFSEIGPLGPTVNDAGLIAFRAKTAKGADGIFTVGDDNAITTIADTTTFVAFHGLPLIDREGAIVFRADAREGGQGIYMSRRGRTAALVTTGKDLLELGLFPSLGSDGHVAFTATTPRGSAIFTATVSGIRPIAESGERFLSFRSALMVQAEVLYVVATEAKGKLGLHSAKKDMRALLSIGSDLEGSKVTELAMNPVSVNGRGQLAIRVKLSDGRELIVRADPKA